jgi:hypothetical protein
MLLDMPSTRLKGSAQAIRQLARDPARGRLFWWLYDEYDAIRASTLGRRIPWRILLGQIQILGLTNAAGRTVSREKEAKRPSFGSLRVPPPAAMTASGPCARNLIGTLPPFRRTVRSP